MRPPPAAEASPPAAGREEALLRFGATERRLHWAMVLPYLVLGLTGSWLLIGDALGGSRAARGTLVATHVAAGCALVLLPLLVLAFSRPEPFLGLFREAWRWRLADVSWLIRSFLRLVFPRVRLPPAGRFNAGQRLNLLHVFALLPVLVASGFACWFAPAAILLRAIHAAGALASLLLAAGHMYLALAHPSTRKALGAMFHGRVPLAYAEHHHPAWFEEATGRRAAEPPGPRRRVSRLALAAIAAVLVPSIVILVHAPARRGAREAVASALGPFLEEPLRAIEPAPLSPLHAAEKDLARCTGCHDLDGVVSSRRCIACHEPIARRMETRMGYHGSLQGECASCHADHGPRLIALEDAAFNHDRAAYRLRGKHIDLACDSCHRRKGEERRRYVGIETGSGCASCHADPHGRPEAACSGCHGEDGIWSAAGFDHGAMARFALDGLHRGIGCGTCHGEGEKRRFRYGPADDAAAAGAFSCAGCHRTIASALRGEIAGLEVIASPHEGTVSCIECHEPSSPSPKPCSGCHPADYDVLEVEWYGRLEIERLRLRDGGLGPEARAVRELRAHNWEGTARWLRGEAGGPGSTR